MNKKLLILLIVIAVLVIGLLLFQRGRPVDVPLGEDPGAMIDLEGFPVGEELDPIREVPLMP